MVEFRVMLTTLCDTVKLFGELYGLLRLEYSSEDKQLVIAIEDNSSSSVVINTEFKLQTVNPREVILELSDGVADGPVVRPHRPAIYSSASAQQSHSEGRFIAGHTTHSVDLE